MKFLKPDMQGYLISVMHTPNIPSHAFPPQASVFLPAALLTTWEHPMALMSEGKDARYIEIESITNENII